MSVKIIFLDIDGVLINRECYHNASGINALAHPSCVSALNHITDQTGASIVVSSTWRKLGFAKVRDRLRTWGVIGKIRGITPELHKSVGNLIIAQPRGAEIQDWITDYENSQHTQIDSFVILDDDNDMGELQPFLVRTEFETGLTLADADKAIDILLVAKEKQRLQR